MFSLGDGTKFWLYTKPTDMRKNFNMLSGIVNGHMGTKFGASPPRLTAKNPVVFSEHHHPKMLKTL